MAICKNCGKKQSKLNQGRYCKSCFNDIHKGEVSLSNTQVLNESFYSNDIPQNIMDLYNSDKAVNELSINEFTNLIENILKPLKDDVFEIKGDIKVKLESHERRINLLEADRKKKQEEINALKSVVVNMQSSLNQIDNENRKTNIIITGIPETDIITETQGTLNNDEEKVRYILSEIGDESIDADYVNGWNVNRIGKVRENSTRAVKIKTRSMEERDNVLKLAPKMKGLIEPWKKIYLKKDLHPVYVKENQRMRKKKYDLTKLYESDEIEHDIKLVKGKLLLDGVMVDQNMFFQ